MRACRECGTAVPMLERPSASGNAASRPQPAPAAMPAQTAHPVENVQPVAVPSEDGLACPHCGEAIRPGMLRCRNCNQPVPTTASAPVEAAPIEPPAESPPSDAPRPARVVSAPGWTPAAPASPPAAMSPPAPVPKTAAPPAHVPPATAAPSVSESPTSRGTANSTSVERSAARRLDRSAEFFLAERAKDAAPQAPADDKPVVRKKFSSSQRRKLQKVLATVGDSKPRLAEDRKSALQALGPDADLAIVPGVVGALNDTWIIVRQAAAQVLGRIGSPDAVEPLIELLGRESDPDVRRAVGQSLAQLGDPSAVPALIQAAALGPRDRTWAIDAITSYGPRAVQPLVAQLRHTNPKARAAVAIALGKVQATSAVKPLLALLGDPDTQVRQEVARSLGLLKHPASAVPLLQLLDAPEEEVRSQAASALSHITAPQTVPRLLEALQDESLEVRVHVVAALGAQKDVAAVPSLLPLVRDFHEELRLATVDALGQFESDDAAQGLCQALSDPSTQVRERAAHGLGGSRAPGVLEALLHALEDRSPNVRQEVCQSLGQIGDKAALHPFYRLLTRDPSNEVRLSILRSVGQIGDVESIPVLKELLNDEFSVRCRACIALGQIGSDEAVDALIPMLNDSVAEVRHHAASALGNVGAKRALQHLERLIDDPDPFVRRGVGKALQQLGDPRGEKLLEEIQQQQLSPKTKKGLKSSSGFKLPPRQRTSLVKAMFARTGELGTGIVGLLSPAGLRDRIDEIGSEGGPKSAALVGGAATAVALLAFLVYWVFFAPASIQWMPEVSSLAPGNGETITLGVKSTRRGVGADNRTRSSIETLNLTTRKVPARVILPDAEGVDRVAMRPDGKFAASADVSGTIYLCDVEQRKVVKTIKAHAVFLKDLVFTLQGDKLLSVDKSGVIKVFDGTSGDELDADNIGTSGFQCAALSPDGTKAAFGLPGGIIRIRNIDSKTDFASIPGHAKAVSSVAFSSDGKTLATVSADGMLALWDLVARVRKFKGDGQPTYFIRFSPDGKLLAAALSDGSIQVWNVDEQKFRQCGTGFESVAALSFSGDGKVIGVMSGIDSTIVLFDSTTLQRQEPVMIK